MNPFYLATSMAKPMTLPFIPSDLHNYEYSREFESDDVQYIRTEISEAEFVIKSPSTSFSEAMNEAAATASVNDKDKWFHEKWIVPNEHTTYFKFLVVKFTISALDHFTLEPCTRNDLLQEIQSSS